MIVQVATVNEIRIEDLESDAQVKKLPGSTGIYVLVQSLASGSLDRQPHRLQE